MSATGVADSNPVFETLRIAVQDSIKALAGGGQSTTILPDSFAGYRVTTVASGNDSVTLPPAKAGTMKVITNAAASNSMNVFPAKGETINALGANSAFALTAGKVALFVCMSDKQWHTILTA